MPDYAADTNQRESLHDLPIIVQYLCVHRIFVDFIATFAHGCYPEPSSAATTSDSVNNCGKIEGAAPPAG